MIVKGQIRNRAGMELALLAGKSMGKWGELLAKRLLRWRTAMWRGCAHAPHGLRLTTQAHRSFRFHSNCSRLHRYECGLRESLRAREHECTRFDRVTNIQDQL